MCVPDGVEQNGPRVGRRMPLGIHTALDIDDLIREQANDEFVQKLWEIAEGKHVDGVSIRDQKDALGIRKIAGVVVKDVPRSTGEVRSRIVVPQALQLQIVQDTHCLSHAGENGTYRALQLDHWFRDMKKTVKQVVSSCKECIAVKGRPLVPEVMAPDERPIALGDRWHIDGLQLPLSEGFDHLMVAVDAATKYVILTKCLGETSRAATDTLMEISSRFGRPKQVTTDRGRAFMSNLFMAACQALFIQFKPVAVKQPQANGMVERVNRTIIQIAKTVCKGDGSQWAHYVKEIEYAINTRISSVTEFSPYELVYGRTPPGPLYMDVIRQEEMRETTDDERIRILRMRIDVLQRLAHENQLSAAEHQKEYHDAHAQAHTFNVNDTVWLYKQSTVQGGITSKLKYNWHGPYTVEKVITPVTFILKDPQGNVLPGTHHARCMYKVVE